MKEETKEQAESRKKEVPTKAKEDPMPAPALKTPVSANAPLQPRRRSGKVVLSECGRKEDSDLESFEKDMREQVSRAVARVLDTMM